MQAEDGLTDVTKDARESYYLFMRHLTAPFEKGYADPSHKISRQISLETIVKSSVRLLSVHFLSVLHFVRNSYFSLTSILTSSASACYFVSRFVRKPTPPRLYPFRSILTVVWIHLSQNGTSDYERCSLAMRSKLLEFFAFYIAFSPRCLCRRRHGRPTWAKAK